MSRHIYDLLTGVSVILLLLVFGLLLRGPARKFAGVLVYVAWQSLSTLGLTIAEVFYQGAAAATAATSTEGQRLYTHLYWTNEVVLDLLQFLLVILLTYQATEGSSTRRPVGRLLAGIVTVV